MGAGLHPLYALSLRHPVQTIFHFFVASSKVTRFVIDFILFDLVYEVSLSYFHF